MSYEHPADCEGNCCTGKPTFAIAPPVKDVPIGDPKLTHANAAQRKFDAQYISSLEIAERLGVSRPAVLHARTSGKLPEPICVNGGQIYVWQRSEVEPFLAAWELSVRMRRGEQVVVQTGPGLKEFQAIGRALRTPVTGE